MEKFWSGGFLYNPQNNSVLLHKRDSNTKFNPNSWAFFGGTREKDERPKETFTREMKEELNIEISEDRVIYLCDYLNEELNIYRHIFYVESDLRKDEMKLGEGADFEWVSLEKVFSYDLTEKTVKDLKFFVKNKK
ncbi:MAG: NUDIX domain-containing protein [Candidatus Moranbacteria bacterium]|nr:NUDIX domain-containing protein [Candidatus Moranbacteria bacterium]